MINQFEQTVADALKDCPPGTICLAAVSGGADSTAMLAALAAIRTREPTLKLHCIHIEHGIRPLAESGGDAGFVQSLCESLGVPCRVVSIPPGKIAATAKKRGIGIEAAARLYRRRAWFREAAACGSPDVPVRILVAHTADDMLETALMRILRGAGPSGLAAMSASRGRILRPLLSLSRVDVLGYLTEKNIPWREDSSNTDTKFLRNRIRHRLIPMLNDNFPHWQTTIAALAETQSLTASFIRDEAASHILWQPLFEDTSRQGAKAQSLGDIKRGVRNKMQNPSPPSRSLRLGVSARENSKKTLFTNAETFFAQPAIVREEALFQGIDRLLAGRVMSSTVKRVNIRRFSEGKVTAVDLGPLQLRKNAQQVTISTRNPLAVTHSEKGFSLLINAPGLYTLKGIVIDVCEYTESDKEGGVFLARLPFVIRSGIKEDRIDGHHAAGRYGMTAVDTLGHTAFIGFNGLVCCRDNGAAQQSVNAEKLYMVKVIKGE